MHALPDTLWYFDSNLKRKNDVACLCQATDLMLWASVVSVFTIGPQIYLTVVCVPFLLLRHTFNILQLQTC